MNIKHRASLLLLVVINGVYSCKDNKNFSTEYSQKSYAFNRLTGKDIYKGIVFGYGKVAEEIPEIKNSYHNNLNELELQKKEEVIKKLEDKLQEIQLKDPLYFNNIEQAVKDKDV